MVRSTLPLLVLLALAACRKDKDTADTDTEPSPLLGVSESERWTLPGLSGEAYVVYTAMGVPHVFAQDKADLGRVVGFTLARDRFFYMDLASRLSLGEVASLLGPEAVETDAENRAFAATFIADRVMGLIDADPEISAYFDGVAAGVNAYIDAVGRGELDPPSEYVLAAPLLAAPGTTLTAVDLMTPWDRRRVVGGMITILYETGFETKDVGRARDALRLPGLFDGKPEAALRQAGLSDHWDRVDPPNLVAQAPDWQASGSPPPPPRRARQVPVHPGVLERLYRNTQAMERRLGHDWETGFGSNAWVVAGAASADGRAMLATDGHLQLSVPPLFYQIGIDTKHLGGGDVQQVGMMTPALPLMSTGTNGEVAFGQTQLIGDITDWYAERLVLGPDGAPAASQFQGGEQPLQAFEEAIEFAAVNPLLGGPEGGTFRFTRYTTFDGRWITSIEGTEVSGPEAAGAGQTAVYLGGDWIVPGDEDGNGFIDAVSFDYAGLDLSNMAAVIDRYGKSGDVDGFGDAMRDLVAYSLNLVVADRSGSIFYSGFQAVPCRGYLPRNQDGTWKEGADPNLLLHGWEHPGFTIPVVDGRVDVSQGADPTRCVVPFEAYPQSRDPASGFLVSANNDPGGLTFDGSLTNDPHYIGGPWMEGYRADEITRQLAAKVAAGGVSVEDMKEIQGNHTSVLGRQLAPELLAAIDRAQGLADPLAGAPEPDSADARILDLYSANAARIDEVATRIQDWAERGFQAESGVETFYHAPTPDEVQDAVATMIFNAWMKGYFTYTVNDEGLPGFGFPTGDTGRTRLLTRMLAHRSDSDPGPAVLASWNPETGESIYFDRIDTPDVVETSTEVAIQALVDALATLEGPPEEAGHGGFDTRDMNGWVWGLRHHVRMTSLLGDFFSVGDNPLFDSLIRPFNITPERLPLADTFAPDDPRADLPGFPRPCDNLCVDAANSGTGGSRYSATSGSVWRLVVALGGEAGFEAYNVIPGGQNGILPEDAAASGLSDPTTFTDQAALWLANDYLPVQLYPEDVAAAGERRSTFVGE